MSLPIKHTLGILSDNLRLRGSVMPLSGRKAIAWAKGLNLPRGGETILYTGHMYQLMPATVALSRMMAEMDASDSWHLRFMGLGRIANTFINTSQFMARPDSGQVEVFNRYLANIARLLQRAGVTFGYLYEKELYAGALIHDEGVDDVFAAHARRVWQVLKSNGVKRVVTVDPHTTNMLRHVYREIIPEYDIEVKSYLEALAEAGIEPATRLAGDVVVHDSCVYARYEDVVDQPRQLLSKTGLHLKEIENGGRLTHCCGGPIESLFPKKAKAIAETRVKQLEASGCNKVVSMCPICLVNLQHAVNGNGTQVNDISDYLYDAYCGARV
jgi:Fe-S oxidoreductase